VSGTPQRISASSVAIDFFHRARPVSVWHYSLQARVLPSRPAITRSWGAGAHLRPVCWLGPEVRYGSTAAVLNAPVLIPLHLKQRKMFRSICVGRALEWTFPN
jgi:hypothetical protein